MPLNLHDVVLWKKMIYTTGENFAIFDQHPIGEAEGAGGGVGVLPNNNDIQVHEVP